MSGFAIVLFAVAFATVLCLLVIRQAPDGSKPANSRSDATGGVIGIAEAGGASGDAGCSGDGGS